jgi:hypothetical protein
MAYGFVKASSQHLIVADNSALDVTNSISVVCWVKRSTDLTTEQQFITKYQSSGLKIDQRSYLLGVSPTSGNLFFILSSNGTGAAFTRRDSSTATSNAWQHYCGTFSPNNYPNVYLNGSLSNGTAQGSLNTAIHSGTADLAIGGNSNGLGGYVTGDIAEVGIWNAALTAAEIASLAKGMSCDKVRPQNLVFYAPLVRDLIDARGGLTITNNNGATVANHPRVYA